MEAYGLLGHFIYHSPVEYSVGAFSSNRKRVSEPLTVGHVLRKRRMGLWAVCSPLVAKSGPPEQNW